MAETITITSAGGVEVERELAGLGGRSLGYIYDWHIRVLISLAWFYLGILIITGSLDVENAFNVKEFSELTYWSIAVPLLALNILYHPVLEIIMNGRTPGKRMAGIRIVSKDGTTASAGAILLRNVFRLIDSLPAAYGIGIIVVLRSKQHLRIGDMAAGTVLIYEDKADRKRLDMVTQSDNDSGITATQRELVAELLGRWKELSRDKRQQFAKNLLEKCAQPVPAATQADELDMVLKQALENLLK